MSIIFFIQFIYLLIGYLITGQQFHKSYLKENVKYIKNIDYVSHKKRKRQEPLDHFPPCKDTERKQLSASQKKRPSPDMESSSTLILDFLASSTVRNNVCCLSHLIYGILLQQHKPTKTLPKSDKSKTKLITLLRKMPAPLSSVFSTSMNEITFCPVLKNRNVGDTFDSSISFSASTQVID